MNCKAEVRQERTCWDGAGRSIGFEFWNLVDVPVMGLIHHRACHAAVRTRSSSHPDL